MLCGYSRCLLASVTLACLVWVHWLKRKLYNKTLPYCGAFITQTILTTTVSLFNFRRGCVRVSLCVWLSWAGCCSLSAICSSQCVVICKTPKLQAYTQASTLSAGFKTRNSLCPLWYTVSCVSGALASVPFSFVLLSNEPAEVTVSWMRRLPASQNIILIS